MHILFIYPPDNDVKESDFQPLGLAYLTSFAQKHDVNVTLLDLNSTGLIEDTFRAKLLKIE